jgi:hypothetical protein
MLKNVMHKGGARRCPTKYPRETPDFPVLARFWFKCRHNPKPECFSSFSASEISRQSPNIIIARRAAARQSMRQFLFPKRSGNRQGRLDWDCHVAALLAMTRVIT